MSEHEVPETVLARVQRVIDMAKAAERAGNDEDARAAYAKADAIMTKYAIDRALLEFAKPDKSTRQKPVSVTIDFPRSEEEFSDEMSAMFSSVVHHNRCRAVMRPWSGEAIVVGFSEDVEYTQMLWAGLLLAFASKINPTWDPQRTADENIKVLKEAGRKWGYIADLANAHGFECTSNDGRLKAAYRRQCKVEGVAPTAHTQRNTAYRAAYAQAFATEIRSRVYRMSQTAEDQVRQSAAGTAVALRDRSMDVEDMFYELFPHLRPMSKEEKAELQRKIDDENRAEAARLANMTPAQRAEYERRQRRERERDQARWERERAKTNDAAGRSAGRNAARTVDLGAGKVGTGRRGEIEA